VDRGASESGPERVLALLTQAAKLVWSQNSSSLAGCEEFKYWHTDELTAGTMGTRTAN
jgi:hypothetical protein